MVADLKDLQRRMDGAIASYRHDLSSLRTGRASSSLLDAVHVSAYGNTMRLHEVATISAPEARMLSVSVWDKSLVSAVDRAIRESDLGFNPLVEGSVLRIALPELTQQRRKELVKLAHTYAENAKIAARHIRRDGMDHLKKEEKEGKISEDDHHRETEKIQKLTDDTITRIDEFLSVKESEIMQI